MTSWLGAARGIVDPAARVHWREGGSVWLGGPIDLMRGPILAARDVMDREARGPGPALLALENSPELLLAVMACLVGGRPFCIVSPDRAATLLEALSEAGPTGGWRPALVVSREIVPSRGAPVVPPERLTAGPPGVETAPDAEPPEPSAVLYFQATSGSSGGPKLVPVTRRMILAQCEAIRQRAGVNGEDVMAAWLPMSHDLGLMAFLLMLRVGGTYAGSSPAQFRRWPLSWLGDVDRFRATLTTAPSFALSVVSQWARRDAALDLSCLRCAWIGAEPVYEAVVDEFQRTFEPMGLGAHVTQPAYGMAETVVGVAFSTPGAPLRRAAHPLLPPGEGQARLLSNGPPLPGIEVAVWSEKQEALAEGAVGRIMVRGESVVAAYWGRESDLVRGWRDTGDLGFLRDGEVYVVGRIKDIIIRGGVNHAAEDLERTTREALGEGLARVAAFSHLDHGAAREWVHLVIERRRGEGVDRIALSRAMRARHGMAPDFIHVVEKGTIPLTSSGKVRRHLLRDRYAAMTVQDLRQAASG